MPHLAPLILALVLSATGAASARSQAPDCLHETLPAARAACIDARADALILAIDGAIARIAAGIDSVRLDLPIAEGTLAARLAEAETEWLTEMEEACATISAPDLDRERLARATCRLEEAHLRGWELSTLFGPAFDRPDPYAGYDPFVSIRPRRGGGFARPEVFIDLAPP